MVHLNHSMAAERKLRRIYGVEASDLTLEASVGYPVPLPISGAGLFAVDGIVIPRMAGGVGFTSLSDLISEATAGKQQTLNFGQVGTSAVTSTAESLWTVTGFPSQGVAPSALPGGSVPTRATQGALGQANPGGTDTLHIVSAVAAVSAVPTLLFVYDRLWYGAMAMNSTGAQSVTGVPNRYTGTAAAGNVMWAEIRTTLAATAHNITYTYTDEAGNTGNSTGAIAGISGGVATRMDHAGWFVPLVSGDLGVRALTQVQASAAVATGQIDLVIARPLMMIPINGSAGVQVDAINSAFNLIQVQTDACIAFFGYKGSGNAMTYGGQIVMVSG